jgi:PAS domain S-box-containing protein
MVVAPDWNIVYANAACRGLFDAGTQVIGKPLATLFPGAKPAGDLERIAEACRTRRTVSGRGLPRVLRPGAPVTWWDDDIHPLPDPDGSIPAVLIMAREVTGHIEARREADEAKAILAKQAEQMRLALGAARMFFWDWDIASGRVEWSEGLEAACGLPPGGFAGTVEAFRALVHPDDQPRVETGIHRALAGTAAYDTEFRILRGDGGIRWVASRGTVLRDAAGRPVRFVGIDLAITQRRAELETVQANEERLRLAKEAASLGLWEYHPRSGASVLCTVYRALHGLTDAAADRLDMDGWLALLHPDDRTRMRDATFAMEDTGSLEAEYRILRADTGEMRWLHSRAARFNRDTGPVLLGIVQDVTERKQSVEALHAAMEARGLLIREADHRIKNSLQLVGGLLRLQERRTAQPEARGVLRAAFARVMAIGDIHRTLYQSADLRTVDLAQVLAELARHAGGLASAVSLRCDLPDSLLLDAERAIPLGLVVNELATNAVQHVYPAGQGGTVTIQARGTTGAVTVSVADEGVGLPGGDATPGLGGTIVKALGRQIGATIETRTAPGAGTSVTLRLPL